MADVPLLFSASMVRALLSGKKTQTRRLVKHGRGLLARGQLLRFDIVPEWGRDGSKARAGRFAVFGDSIPDDPVPLRVRAPIVPGDRVWVRETWGLEPGSPDDYGYLRFQADGSRCQTDGRFHSEPTACSEPHSRRWRPSIHMPRWASRITRTVVSVRAEPVQDITDDDAKAEGVEPVRCECCAQSGGGCTEGPCGPCCPCCSNTGIEPYGYAIAFQKLWDEINGERAPWAWNPMVWVYELSEVKP